MRQKQGITRREFLKGAGAVLAGAAAMGLLGGCGAPEASAAAGAETAAKAAALEGDELVATIVVPTGFNGVDAAWRLADELRERGIDPTACDANVVATGYGRVSVPYAGKTVTEITCHGRGAAYLFGGDGCNAAFRHSLRRVRRGSPGSRQHLYGKCEVQTQPFAGVLGE